MATFYQNQFSSQSFGVPEVAPMDFSNFFYFGDHTAEVATSQVMSYNHAFEAPLAAQSYTAESIQFRGSDQADDDLLSKLLCLADSIYPFEESSLVPSVYPFEEPSVVPSISPSYRPASPPAFMYDDDAEDEDDYYSDSDSEGDVVEIATKDDDDFEPSSFLPTMLNDIVDVRMLFPATLPEYMFGGPEPDSEPQPEIQVEVPEEAPAPVKPTKFACNLCDKVVTKEHYLQQHLKAAHSSNPFKCSKCKKAFDTEEKLNEHMERHTLKNKMHACQFCDKSYYYAPDLKRHTDKHHTGSTKHNCHICEKKFTRPDQLRKHLLVHEKKMKSVNKK